MSRRYSTELFKKAEEVFHALVKEYDPIGRVIMPMDIRKRLGVSGPTVYCILRDADWWSPERKHAMQTLHGQYHIHTAKNFSVESFRKAEEAFYSLAKEYDSIGKVVMPMDIAERSGLSRITTKRILRDATWWDGTRKNAVTMEVVRRFTDKPGGCTGKGYSPESFRKVESVFRELANEYDPIGKAIMPGDICARVGLSKSTLTPILRDASWWDESRRKAVRKNISISANQAQREKGWPAFKKGRVTQLVNGHTISGTNGTIIRGNCTRMRIIEYLKVFPGSSQLQIAKHIGITQAGIHYHLQILRSHGVINEDNRLEGETKPQCNVSRMRMIHSEDTQQQIIDDLKVFPGSSQSQIASRVGVSQTCVWRHLQILRRHGIASEYNYLLTGEQYIRSVEKHPFPNTHIQGNVTRSRIIEFLGLSPGSSLSKIAQAIGMGINGSVSKHLRILHAQGLIDEHNRPIQQDTSA